MNIIQWQRPTFATWPGLRRVTDWSDEIDRIFESPLTELTRSAQLRSGAIPAVDVYEAPDRFTVIAELPGLKREDIKVALHEGTLSIAGERKAETPPAGAQVHRAERFLGAFERTVTLPATVATDKVQAAYKEGVLTITLPKVPEAKPQPINVSVA